jgi:hypothetical protein
MLEILYSRTPCSRSWLARCSQSAAVIGPLLLKLGAGMLVPIPTAEGVDVSTVGVPATGSGFKAAVDALRGLPDLFVEAEAEAMMDGHGNTKTRPSRAVRCEVDGATQAKPP